MPKVQWKHVETSQAPGPVRVLGLCQLLQKWMSWNHKYSKLNLSSRSAIDPCRSCYTPSSSRVRRAENNHRATRMPTAILWPTHGAQNQPFHRTTLLGLQQVSNLHRYEEHRCLDPRCCTWMVCIGEFDIALQTASSEPCFVRADHVPSIGL